MHRENEENTMFTNDALSYTEVSDILFAQSTENSPSHSFSSIDCNCTKLGCSIAQSTLKSSRNAHITAKFGSFTHFRGSRSLGDNKTSADDAIFTLFSITSDKSGRFCKQTHVPTFQWKSTVELCVTNGMGMYDKFISGGLWLDTSAQLMTGSSSKGGFRSPYERK